MRKIVSLFTMLMLASMLAFAQTRPITGKVTDETGQPISGASILVKGTSTGASADANGNFTINAKTGDVLQISAVGSPSREVTVTSGSTVNISLSKQSAALSEVVVTTALGVQRQARALGYSTASIKSGELTQAAPINLQNGLTGKVSGLNISTTSSSVAGNNTRITLRGIRSLTGNNQPMLILDGTPIALGFLNSINPNDIADVSILKSSSATAVYGPDGVNGAIVITTKRGSRTRPIISVGQTLQWESISYMPKFQEKYGSGYAPDPLGYGTYESIEQQSWGPEFDGLPRQIGQKSPTGDSLMVPYSYIKNGRKKFFNTGLTSQTDISYSTGDFYLSAQNVSVKSTVPGDVSDRRTFTLKAERETGRFKANFNLRYTNTTYDATSNSRLVYYNVTGAPGQIDLSQFSDWKNNYFSSPNGYYTPYLDNVGKTPYFAKDNYRDRSRTDDILGNVQLDFKVASWMNLTYRVGTTVSNNDLRNTRGAFTYSAYHGTLRDHGTVNITSAITNTSTFQTRLTSEIFANFNKKFESFGVNATVGQQFRRSKVRQESTGSNNLGTSELLSIAARRGEPNATFGTSETALERYFYRVGFDYQNWAFLETTGSYDFDSRLALPGGKYQKKSDIGFFYPGVSISAVLSDAIPALKDNRILNFAKVRAALSKTGNVNLGAYAYEDIFASALFFPYGETLGYQATASTAAKKYDPEFVVNKEVGIELGFMKNRINFEATYYNQDNTRQIIDVQQSNTTGYTTATQNAAAFVNKGYEFDLKLTPLVKINNVNVDFRVNYTNQSNEVTGLVNGVNELGLGNFNYVIVGQSAYKFKLTDYVRDPQGHVIVDKETGMPTQNPNLTTFGNTLPKHILGLNLNVNWKGLTFSAVAEYRAGNQIVVDDLGAFMDDNGISQRSAQNGRRAFVFPNSVYQEGDKYVTNTNIYTQQYGRLFWNSDLNTAVESNYLASGAFWKIREVALTYNIPVTVFGNSLGKVIKGATIGVNGRNLFMFLPKSNQWTDPEFSTATATSNQNATGRSLATNLPPTRLFGANLVLRF